MIEQDLITKIRDLERRLKALENVNQSGILKYGNITIDGTNNRILLTDGTNNRVVLDGVTGKIKVSRVGHDVLTAANKDLVMSSDFAFVKETWLQMLPGWYGQWSVASAYTDAPGALCVIDFDDWPDHSWYFDIVAKVDGATGDYKIYNVTTSTLMAESYLTTTSTSAVRLRTSAMTKPSGVNSFTLQYRIYGGNGSQYANFIMGRSVMRLDI